MAEPRIAVNIRVSKPALEAIEKRAAKDSRNRSDMLRMMLAYAERNMPVGWRP